MAIAKRPLRILVADDEPVIADSLATILRISGYHATSVYSGYSAIETSINLQPDVVITDFLMPGTNGIDAVLSISRRVPTAKFVLITGHADTQDILQRARVRGLELMCMHKPVPPQSLIKYLNDCACRLNVEREVVSA